MGADQSKPIAETTKKQDTNFGAFKKLESVEEKPQMQSVEIMNNLDNKQSDIDDKISKWNKKLSFLTEKVKQLTLKGQQKEARKISGEVIRLGKQIKKMEMRKRVVSLKKEQLQNHDSNLEVIQSLDLASKYTKEDITQKIEDHLDMIRENKVIQNQIFARMKEKLSNSDDEDEIDEFMMGLANQIKAEKKKTAAKKQLGEVEKQKNTKDDIEDLLASL